MFRIVAGLTVLLWVAGCTPDKIPENVLTEPEMVRVLIEMYLAEERISRISLPYDSVNQLIPRFREKAFQDAGIAEETYKASMAYYMANPKRLDQIYTAVVDSLSLREQSQPDTYTRYEPPK